MPDERHWAIFGDVGFQYGQGFDPTSQVPITATFMNAVVGVRYAVNRWCHLFSRYEFQWETDSQLHATAAPDFVRHFFLTGIQVAWGTDEHAMVGMVPLEQLEAMEHAAGVSETDPSAAPVRTAAPGIDDTERRFRSHLPGDPPDDELEREAHERDATHGDGTSTPLPGSGPTPGASDEPDGADPFRDDNGEGSR
jgi:hypothetical protein